MLSEEQQSTRSPPESVQSESVHAELTISSSERSHQSSTTEDDNNGHSMYEERSYIQYNLFLTCNCLVPSAPPLPSTLLRKLKSSSISKSSSPTESTAKRTSSSKNGSTVANKTVSQLPQAYRVNSDEKPKHAHTVHNRTTPSLHLERATPKTYDRISVHDVENEKSTSTYALQIGHKKPNLSIFEKIDIHDGHSTYLGMGTSSQLENCIRDCLSRRQPYVDSTEYTTRRSYPGKRLTRASIFEDYSYDDILSPSYHLIPSRSRYCHFDDHKKSAAELSLNEIRQINDALAKYGIPVFSYSDQSNSLPNRPRPIGDILSACRVLLEDPNLRSHGEGSQAVQQAWNAISHSQPSINPSTYAPSPIHSVASGPFSSSSRSPQNAVQNVMSTLSNLYRRDPYNPIPDAASNPFPPQQQHFTESPFSHAFYQYPGNNPHMH